MRDRPQRPGLADVPAEVLLNSSAARNPNGTLNGAKFMAVLTGASEAEIRWIWLRLKQLMQDLAIPREEALDIIRDEAKTHPWKN